MDQFERPTRGRLTRRIVDAIKDQIAAGRLRPGDALPSTRALAVAWGASRTTVTVAYEQLAAEGYLDTRQGAATRVSAELPRNAPAQAPASSVRAASRLSRFGLHVAEAPFPPVHAGPVQIDFRYGDLAAEDFPASAWRAALSKAARPGRERLCYGDPQGSSALRSALQAYLWRARGLRCAADQIVVVNGSQQGLDLVARVLLDPGDTAVMEDPGYLFARYAMSAVGARILPAPVDGEGLRCDGLPSARLAYTTPSHQFPLGGVMSAGRRRALLSWAERHGAYIVEDDYDSEYRYDVAPLPPLHALDDSGWVIYLGTVSKTLSPALRLGVLVLPPALVPVFVKAKRLVDRHTPELAQDALAILLSDGAYERHVRRVRRRNASRRTALLQALSEAFGESVTIVGADAGLHVVAWLNDIARADEDALIARARTRGLGLYPVTALYAAAETPRPDAAGLVIGYAALEERAIRRGVAVLADVIRATA